MTVRALSEELCPSDRADGLFGTLPRAYTSPGRAYHSRQHIAECLKLLELYSQSTSLPDSHRSLLQYALFYHDVVYQPSGNGNEFASARIAAAELAPALSRPEIDALSRLILATSHLTDSGDLIRVDPLG